MSISGVTGGAADSGEPTEESSVLRANAEPTYHRTSGRFRPPPRATSLREQSEVRSPSGQAQGGLARLGEGERGGGGEAGGGGQQLAVVLVVEQQQQHGGRPS